MIISKSQAICIAIICILLLVTRSFAFLPCDYSTPESDNQCMRSVLPPRDPMDFNLWPGNRGFCVSCNFIGGIVVGTIETIAAALLCLYGLEQVAPLFSSKSDSTQPQKAQPQQQSSSKQNDKCCPSSCSSLYCVSSFIGNLLAISFSGFGWLYWFILISVWYNFIAYMFMIGIVLVGPLIGSAITYPSSNAQQRAEKLTQIQRRVKVSGILLGIICVAMFPNVSLMPSQIYRHIRMSETMITPNDPSVLMLRNQFWGNVSADTYAKMEFKDQMLTVDEFIKDTITWKPDMEQYGMIGLLTTPAEVIARQAGDCQGQAVTTASLLMSMGVEAWVVETPFHWWTYARNNRTGQEHFLNYHGSAGLDGTVLPQPIDMVFTHWPARCTNCSHAMAHNQQQFLYIAPPYYALPLAWTGAHIFVREFLPSLQGNEIKLVWFGIGWGAAVSVFASYVQSDLLAGILEPAGRGRLLLRLAFSCFLGILTFIMMFLWIIIHYPFTEIHLIFLMTFTLTYISSDSFNKRIGTPETLRRFNLFSVRTEF